MIFASDNPLNKFLSYTIQYRLFVTTRYEWAQQLVLNINDIHFNKSSNTFDSVTKNFLRTKQSFKNFFYYDVIDSTITTDLFVTSYKFLSYLNVGPNQTRGYGESITMELDIHEAYTGSFIGWLNSILKESDSLQLFFIIKPVFIGITQDEKGNFVEEQLSDNPANIMILTELTADYTTQGSNYHISGVCDIGGIGNIPSKHKNLLSQISINVPRNVSFNDFFEVILPQQLNKLVDNRTVSDGQNKKFLRYKYKIILDDFYKTGDYKFDNISTIHTNTGQNDPTLSFPDCNIYDIITKLLSLSLKINEDAVIKNSSKNIKEKVISKYYRPYITCGISDADNETTYITYTISRQTIYKSNNHLELVSEIEDIKEIEAFLFSDFDEIKKPQIIVYDYLYTGKNVDVIEYKLAITRGLVATILDEKNLVVSGITTIDETSFNTSNTDEPFNNINKPTNTIKVPQTSSIYSDQNRMRGFYDVINRTSFVEVLQNKITVTGNPYIFGSLASSNSTRKEYEIFVREQIPAMLFVNVQYPSSTEFWTSESNYNTSPDLAPFWFRGIQQILTCETVFEGNNFFHVIDTYPLLTEQQAAEDVLQAEKENNQSQPIIRESTAQQAVNKVKQEYNIKVANNASTESVAQKTAQRMNIRLPAPVTHFKLASGTPLHNNKVTSSYGVERVRTKIINGIKTYKKGYHYGTDLRASVGTPVKSGITGTIRCFQMTISYAQGTSWGIDVAHPNGVVIRYMHIVPLAKFIGKNPVTTISEQDVIGTVQPFNKDSNVYPHVHFELHYEGKIYNSLQVLNNPEFKNDKDVIKINF